MRSRLRHLRAGCPEIANKGIALFQRRINRAYAMLSRQDGENIYVMESDLLHFWFAKRLVIRPTYSWEYVQEGNCGSPIETPRGWLVLTHGVGPMWKYSFGSVLLDLGDPTRVIGRLPVPLLTPNENERAGCMSNVVYSCGGAVHDGLLVIPYATSDYATTFATVPLDEVLSAMAPASLGGILQSAIDMEPFVIAAFYVSSGAGQEKGFTVADLIEKTPRPAAFTA